MTVPFQTSSVYEGMHGHVSYTAFRSTGVAPCESWLKTAVAARVYDQAVVDSFADDVDALATDGFQTAGLNEYLNEPTAPASYWDIGESIASLFLMERHGALLLCNPRRDLRSEKGSLPGADIVGYRNLPGGETVFLFGEVKASGEASSPPSVMASSGSGMVVQLARLATKMPARRQLLRYLKARSDTADSQPLWTAAMKSLGEKKYALTGVLVRDSPPSAKDVDKAAKDLQVRVPEEQELPLFVLHVDIKVDSWSLHCQPS
jgi:hypothetical protein